MLSGRSKKQIEENHKEIVRKRFSTKIILEKTTEKKAMELDAEGGASFAQLQDLIKKECDKGDKNIDPWKKNTINYKAHLSTRNHKKFKKVEKVKKVEKWWYQKMESRKLSVFPCGL